MIHVNGPVPMYYSPQLIAASWPNGDSTVAVNPRVCTFKKRKGSWTYTVRNVYTGNKLASGTATNADDAFHRARAFIRRNQNAVFERPEAGE